MRKKLAVSVLAANLADKAGSTTTTPRCPKKIPCPCQKSKRPFLPCTCFLRYDLTHTQQPGLEGKDEAEKVAKGLRREIGEFPENE